jgi:DNA-binding NarL/FixJ family response regulator
VEAVAAARSLSPDVVLMDVRMPNLDGLEATRRLSERRAGNGCRVLILTTFDLDDYVYESIRSGASGFLKDAPPKDLVRAVRTVAGGEALLAPSVTRRLIEEFTTRPGPVKAPKEIDSLTERELEVLKLIARGLSNAEITERLYLGETTVKTHVGRVRMKLGLRDRVQAVVLAYESGLVQPGAGA